MENINWYPGHMKKTRQLIGENLKMVDACIEVIDARIPVSSRNPIVDELISGKPRVIVLNKSDLADMEADEEGKTAGQQREEGFSDPIKETQTRLKRDAALQEAVNSIRRKYGKDAMIRGMDLEEAATTRERNHQIGGHRE